MSGSANPDVPETSPGFSRGAEALAEEFLTTDEVVALQRSLQEKNISVVVAKPERSVGEGCQECGKPIAPDGSLSVKLTDGDGALMDLRAWHLEGCAPKDMKQYMKDSWPEAARFFADVWEESE